MNRRGGIHAPAIPAPRQSTGSRGQQPKFDPTPSLTHRGSVGRQAAETRAPLPLRPARGGDIRSGAGRGSNTSHSGFPGNSWRGGQDFRGSSRVAAGARESGSDHSRIGNQPFSGNAVNFNNRRFNLGHSSYRPSYYRHSRYHGYWNGNRGFAGRSGSDFGYGSGLGRSLRHGIGSAYGYGGLNGPGWGWGLGSGYGYGGGYRGHRIYGYRPFGWGLGGWGLGSLIYNSGYLGYSNPYYINAGPSVYNYSQPIQVMYTAPVADVGNDPDSADEALNTAVTAFQQSNFDAALDITNKGIARYSDDAVLHEFRSLVLFAKQDYQQSAATIHSVLAVGPGWDWTTLSSMYSSVAVYTDQLRNLEAFVKADPQDAASQFLLAYHYMSCGYPDAAARCLQEVVRLQPGDRVAADMLKMVAAPQPGETAEPPAPQESTQSAATLIDPATLVGAWNAVRGDGSVFRLILTSDAKFTWSFAQKDQAAQEFGGTYTFEENVLALERIDGGSLIAEVTPAGQAAFNFRLLGAPDDDQGLDFSR